MIDERHFLPSVERFFLPTRILTEERHFSLEQKWSNTLTPTSPSDLPQLAMHLWKRGRISDNEIGAPGAALAVGAFMMMAATMFLNSCTYHALFYVINVSRAMQVLDHAGIYLLIAGTYAPTTILACRKRPVIDEHGVWAFEAEQMWFPYVIVTIYVLLALIGRK